MADLDQISQAIGEIKGILETRIQEHDKVHGDLKKRLGLNGDRGPLLQGAKTGGAAAVLVAVVELIKLLV